MTTAILKFCISFKFFLYQITENSGGLKQKGTTFFHKTRNRKLLALRTYLLPYGHTTVAPDIYSYSSHGMRDRSGISHTFPILSRNKSIPRQSLQNATSFSLVRMMLLGLFSKAYNTHNISFFLLSFFFSFFFEGRVWLSFLGQCST